MIGEIDLNGPASMPERMIRLAAALLACLVLASLAGLELLTSSSRRFDGVSHSDNRRRLVLVEDFGVRKQIQTIYDSTEGSESVRRSIFDAQTGALLLDETL